MCNVATCKQACQSTMRNLTSMRVARRCTIAALFVFCQHHLPLALLRGTRGLSTCLGHLLAGQVCCHISSASVRCKPLHLSVRLWHLLAGQVCCHISGASIRCKPLPMDSPQDDKTDCNMCSNARLRKLRAAMQCSLKPARCTAVRAIHIQPEIRAGRYCQGQPFTIQHVVQQSLQYLLPDTASTV